jgi:hypothetical protein
MWTGTAIRLATALHKMPSDLWPEELRDAPPKHPGAEVEVSSTGLEDEEDPEDVEWDAIKRIDVAAMLGKLTKREELAIRLNFGIGCGSHTLDEVSQLIGGVFNNRVTRERARQIICKGMRKLKHPSRSGDYGGSNGHWSGRCRVVKHWPKPEDEEPLKPKRTMHQTPASQERDKAQEIFAKTDEGKWEAEQRAKRAREEARENFQRLQDARLPWWYRKSVSAAPERVDMAEVRREAVRILRRIPWNNLVVRIPDLDIETMVSVSLVQLLLFRGERHIELTDEGQWELAKWKREQLEAFTHDHDEKVGAA